MEYLVTMTTHVPAGTSDDTVADVRAREAENSRRLAGQGRLLRLWRPPLAPGEWRTLGLFSAADDDELDEVLTSMPLRIWRSDEVTPLAPHPNDPEPERRAPRGSVPEFFTTFTIQIPTEASGTTVDDLTSSEAARAGELADGGTLARLWLLPAVDGRTRALGLWRAADEEQLKLVLSSLPMSSWMTVETIPLTSHPSDPAATSAR